mgnify:CR=1 FL=1
MKIDFRIVIVIIIALFFVNKACNKIDEPVKDVTIITPEEFGEVEKKLDSVIRDTVYIEINNSSVKKEIVVDSLYKAKYETALKNNDTLKAKNLFLESIALDTYEGNLIDNDDIKIDGRFLTRGKLLEYDIRYKIKSDTITYIPEVRTKHPKLSLVYGLSVGIPTDPLSNTKALIKAQAGLQFKSGDIITLGYDTEDRVSVGYYKTLKIFK